jgi:hypothetical protein
LFYARERLAASASGFARDVGTIPKSAGYQKITDKQAAGKTLTRHEEAYITRMNALNDTIKKNTAALLQSIQAGDTEAVIRQTPEITRSVDEAGKAAGRENAPDAARDTRNAARAIGTGQVLNAVSDGFSRWVDSLDRSGIVGKYGSGDIIGAKIDEKRRGANFWGGIAQGGLTIAGAAAGTLIGNPIAGAAVGSFAGNAVRSALNIEPNLDATKKAYADLWQSKIKDAMELAALKGTPGNVRGSFTQAASAAARYGYSAEEGMATWKDVARLGVTGSAAGETVKSIFQWERGTGADRGTLTQAAGMTERYGAGDALRAGWHGLQASGMSTGQFSEYLRAMQRVMEDGISKGFVRSSEEVSQKLAWMAQIGGSAWSGEAGAQKFLQMNSGLEQATGLRTTSDIVAYRAARNISGGGSYIDAMKVLEGGLTPRLLSEFLNLTKRAEGGSREGVIERMRQTFGLSYTNADILYNAHGSGMGSAGLQELIDGFQEGPPSADSKELDAARITEAIKNYWTQTGMVYWEKQLPELRDALVEAIAGLKEAQNSVSVTPKDSYKLKDTTGMTPAEIYRTRQQEYREAVKSNASPETIDVISRAVELARIATLNPKSVHDDVRSIQDRSTKTVGGFFDVGGLFPNRTQKEDSTAANKIYTVLDNAATSGNERQIRAAADTLRAFDSVPKEVRERWDKENTVNSLGNAQNIDALLAALNRLIEVEIRNGNMTVSIEG